MWNYVLESSTTGTGIQWKGGEEWSFWRSWSIVAVDGINSVPHIQAVDAACKEVKYVRPAGKQRRAQSEGIEAQLKAGGNAIADMPYQWSMTSMTSMTSMPSGLTISVIAFPPAFSCASMPSDCALTIANGPVVNNSTKT